MIEINLLSQSHSKHNQLMVTHKNIPLDSGHAV